MEGPGGKQLKTAKGAVQMIMALAANADAVRAAGRWRGEDSLSYCRLAASASLGVAQAADDGGLAVPRRSAALLPAPRRLEIDHRRGRSRWA